MDLQKAIRQLYAERARLDRVIASLEELEKAAAEGLPRLEKKSRRGRKMMTFDERRQVSRRMKQYWERRRKETNGGDSPAPKS